MQLRMRKKFYISALAVSLIVGFSGCSSSTDSTPPEAKELNTVKKSLISGSESELFAKAKRLYSSQLYTQAREVFDELVRLNPLGAYGEFSRLKAANCSFSSGEYQDAAKRYEEFIQNHPSSPDLPFAQLRQARSWQIAQRGVGRDPQVLQKAKEVYETLLKRESPTPYTSLARAYYKETVELLLTNKQEVADFYQKRGNDVAASERQKELDSIKAPAIKTLKTSESSQADYEKEQLKLLSSIIQESPLQLKTVNELPQKVAPAESQSTSEVSSNFIENVHCEEKLVTVTLSSLPESYSIQTGYNSIQITVPGYNTQTRTFLCGKGLEAELKEASVRVAGTSFSLPQSEIVNFPPRIIVTFE